MKLLIKKFIKDSENTSDLKVRIAYGKFSSVMGIIFNMVLCIAKLTAGTIAGSVAITADAINNLSDASSSIISLLGFRLAGKPADKDHPYGHGRYEYLSGLMVAVLVCAIGIELLKSSFEKIIHPTDVDVTIISLIVLLVSIGVKFYMMYINTTIGKKINSKTLIATAQDSRNDVISTSAVFIAELVLILSDLNIDGYMGLAVAIFIIYSGIGLIKDTLDPILGRRPDESTVLAIHDKIMSYEFILGTHDLMVHDYGPGNIFASVHVEMDAKKDPIESHDIIDNIENDVREELGIHLIIHYDPISTDDGAVSEARNSINTIVKTIDMRLTIHDLRIVPGITHTNVVFDCVAPMEFEMSDEELRNKITTLVARKYPDYICVMKIDRNYAPVM